MVIYNEREQAHHANTLVSSVLFYCSFGDKTVGELTQIVLYTTIDAKTKDEMITKYFFGVKQKEALETLLENGDAFTGTMQSLAVYSDNSHIGIVARRKDNGSLLVIHCAAGANNVVITDEEGFGYCVRIEC